MEIKGNLKSVLSTELAGYLVDTGTANAYAVALRPAITAYTTGLKITFQAVNANTGTSTLAVNGLAVKTIMKNVSTNLEAGDIIANMIVTVIYDGTNFQLISSTIGINKVLLTYNNALEQCVATVVSKAGTVTGTAGVGSSLFLHRLLIPAPMALTEIDAALSIGFPATNQGAGTLSRSMAIYSFGNSTSLASVVSVSGTSSWQTGTSTSGAVVSLTQFQGGWSTPLIQPMTFAGSTIDAGEYVIGQLFNFAQGSSTWTLNFYGANGLNTFLASAATNLTSATLGALSSGGLAAVSAHTGSTSTALTAWSAAASAMAFSGVGSTAGFSTTNVSTFTAGSLVIKATATAASTLSLLLNTATAGFNMLSSAGFSAGSFVGTSGSVGAVTNVALGALSSSTLAQMTLPIFGYIGTGSTTSNFPTAFFNGIMSTGAIPVAITLTSTAVTYSGSIAFQIPWFQLIGS